MSSAPCSRQFTIQVTDQTLQFIDALALRQHTSRSEIVRQAIREYLDDKENVIGSRSRLGHTVMGELEAMRTQFVHQLNHMSALLLAAVILQQVQHGESGTRIMAQITRLADQIEEHLPRKGK